MKHHKPSLLDRLATVSQASPSRLAWRAEERLFYALLDPRWILKGLTPLPPSSMGLPTEFTPLPSPHSAYQSDSTLSILGKNYAAHDLLKEINSLEELAKYHAAYFDWYLPPVAADAYGSTLQSFLEQWGLNHNVSPIAAWAPYPTATRAWSICTAYSHHDSTARDRLRWWLALHRRLLLAIGDRGLGGNHRLRVLKALVGIHAVAGSGRRLGATVRMFAEELARQILTDGGHHERSPAYHAIVMGDAIDVRNLARSIPSAKVPSGLDHNIERMATWLCWIQHPDGSLPRFNDSPSLDESYLTAVRDHRFPDPLSDTRVSPASGYLSLTSHDLRLVADVGAETHGSHPGHLHPEIGAFELSAGRSVVLRNVGTSTYQGPQRQAERATAAHNTVTVGDRNQFAVWGAFRVGRIPSLRSAADGWEHAHDGYSFPGHPVWFRRHFAVSSGQLIIRDQADGEPDGPTISHLYTEFQPQEMSTSLRIGPIALEIDKGSSVRIEQTELAQAMGVRTTGWHILIHTKHPSAPRQMTIARFQ